MSMRPSRPPSRRQVQLRGSFHSISQPSSSSSPASACPPFRSPRIAIAFVACTLALSTFSKPFAAPTSSRTHSASIASASTSSSADVSRKASFERSLKRVGSALGDFVNRILKVDAGIWAALISSSVALAGYRIQRRNARASTQMEAQRDIASLKSTERNQAEAQARSLKLPLLFFLADLSDELNDSVLAGSGFSNDSNRSGQRSLNFLHLLYMLSSLFTWVKIIRSQMPTLGLELERAGSSLDVRLLQRANAIVYTFADSQNTLFHLSRAEQRALGEACSSSSDSMICLIPFTTFVERLGDEHSYMLTWCQGLHDSLEEFHSKYEPGINEWHCLSRLAHVNMHLKAMIDIIDNRRLFISEGHRRGFPLETFGLSASDIISEERSASSRNPARAEASVKRVNAPRGRVQRLVDTLESLRTKAQLQLSALSAFKHDRETNDELNELTEKRRPPRQYGNPGLFVQERVSFRFIPS